MGTGFLSGVTKMFWKDCGGGYTAVACELRLNQVVTGKKTRA